MDRRKQDLRPLHFGSWGEWGPCPWVTSRPSCPTDKTCIPFLGHFPDSSKWPSQWLGGWHWKGTSGHSRSRAAVAAPAPACAQLTQPLLRHVSTPHSVIKLTRSSSIGRSRRRNQGAAGEGGSGGCSWWVTAPLRERVLCFGGERWKAAPSFPPSFPFLPLLLKPKKKAVTAWFRAG